MDYTHTRHSGRKAGAGEVVECDIAVLLAEMDGGVTEGVTVSELADRTGRSKGWIRDRLGRLKQQGRLAIAGYRVTEGLDGRASRVTAYRLVPQE